MENSHKSLDFLKEPYKSRVELWVKELRSGSYEQTTGMLRYDENSYCCLGIACEIYDNDHYEDNGWSFHGADTGYYYNGENAVLPEYVRYYFGISTEYGYFASDVLLAPESNLAWLNDNGSSFEFIADTIEDNPQGLFLKEALVEPQ